MSTGPRMQNAFIQGNQSKADHDASHSALFYLFQEVSKLASPIHNSFLGANSPPTWFSEKSMMDPVAVKNEEEDAHLFQTSNSSFHHSLPGVSPCDQVRNAMEGSHSSKVTTLAEPRCECHSPWKVLSLINLHCEKLLHQSDVGELDATSVSSTTKLGRSTAKLSSADPDFTEEGVRGDSLNAECTLRSRFLRQVTTSVSPVENVTGNSTGEGNKPQCCVKDPEVECSVQLQTIGAQMLEDNATVCLQPQHKYKREVKLSVNRQLEWNQASKKDCFSTELGHLDVPFACLNTQLTFNSNDKVCVGLPEPALTLDHNANRVLSPEPPRDTQHSPPSSIQPCLQSASLIFSTTESYLSLSKQHDKIPDHAPIEEKSSSYDLSSGTPKSEICTVQKEEIPLSSTRQWRTKTPRKQPHPSRSADIQDPDFQGVTFRMDTELDDSREQCRLLITSKYSKELCKSVRKRRLRTRTSQKSLKTSSSEEENDLTANVLKGKVCASCCTRKTPMWRDAEDGTPLCNACGIRYKKYRVRCVNCWHIPRKEGNSNTRCLKCGNFVRLTSAQRKATM